nr:hypothetical protein [Tanacetum cinerariifolium]
AGFWWGAHRASRFDGPNQGLPFHVDLTKTFITASEDVVFQPYIGTNSRDILSTISDVNKRSWVTLAMFEADPDGPQAYLNEVLALGTGRVLNEEVYYEYWILQ